MIRPRSTLRGAKRRPDHQLRVLQAEVSFVIIIGVLLGAIAATIFFCEGFVILGRNRLLALAFSPCAASANNGIQPGSCDPAKASLPRDHPSNVGTAYATYVCYNTACILCASLLTAWSPQAYASGLPPLKAFLNGVQVPNLLTLKTLFAKTAGVTLVVSTGLPLGREGPMVHAGAIIGTLVTRFRCTLFGREWRTPLEVRLPSAQRNWVGIGCAAGVAAAFNAPCGGILYSFEEVCSHWSNKMTWRSFFCVVVAALMYNLFVSSAGDFENGVLLQQGLVLGLTFGPGDAIPVGVYDWLIIAVLGAIGGLLGAVYVRGVVGLNGLRRRILGPRRSARVLEAITVAFLVFSVLFFVPFGFDAPIVPSRRAAAAAAAAAAREAEAGGWT